MRSHRFDIIITVVCFSLLGYFSWHAWEGPRGYPFLGHLATIMAEQESAFSTVHRQRLAIERKTTLLHPDHVDVDLLDELARQRLEMARPQEIVGLSRQIR